MAEPPALGTTSDFQGAASRLMAGPSNSASTGLGPLRLIRVADDTLGIWKVIGHFYVQRDYSVRMGIGKGRGLPGYFVDAAREGASR